MALSFPLSLSGFMDGLVVAGITFDLPEAVEQKTLGNGEIITAANGVRLWEGTVTLSTQTWANHEAAMALIRALQKPGASFLLSPLHNKRVGSPNGTLSAVSGGDARFAGLGAGAVLPVGAMLSFTYGGKRAFHQLVQAVTADGTGLTPLAEVVPPIRTGYSLGTTVTFDTPVLKAVMKPKSVVSANIGAKVAGGVTFAWGQTLR